MNVASDGYVSYTQPQQNQSSKTEPERLSIGQPHIFFISPFRKIQ